MLQFQNTIDRRLKTNTGENCTEENESNGEEEGRKDEAFDQWASEDRIAEIELQNEGLSRDEVTKSLLQFQNDIGFNSFILGLNKLLAGAGLTEFQWPKNTAISGNSLFNACGIIFMIIGIAFSKPLADRFGKRDVFSSALFISTLFILSFFYNF